MPDTIPKERVAAALREIQEALEIPVGWRPAGKGYGWHVLDVIREVRRALGIEEEVRRERTLP